MGPYTFKGEMSEPGTKTWNSQLLGLVYVEKSDRVLAMCERWFRGPKGEAVKPWESSQLWLPVTLDPATATARMEYIKQWDPLSPAKPAR